MILFKDIQDLNHYKKSAKEILGGFGDLSDNNIFDNSKEIHIDGKLVGYIGFDEYDDVEGYNKVLGFGNFMILERGKGYGTQVLQHLVNNYKNEYDLIYCFVDSDNEGAIKLYKKLGTVYDEDGPNDNGQYYVTFWDKNKSNSLKESVEALNIPKYVYHATYPHRWKNIQKSGGLKSNISKKMRNWSDSRDVICVSEDPYAAESYAETALDELDRDWDIIILKIDTSNLDKSKFEYDSNILYDAEDEFERTEYEYHGDIPLSAITVFSENESLTESIINISINELQFIARVVYDAFEEHDIDGNNQNCMLCTWATELQLRGEDILPRPVYSPRDIIFSGKFKGEDIVVNPQKLSIKDKEDVINKVQSAGNGSRFYCHVNWNDSNGGHEFLLVNIDDEIYIVDSQSNYIELIEEDDSYFNDINFKNSYIVRLDDKDINQEILKYNDFDYVVEWDEEIDSKMLEEDFSPNSIIAYHGSNAKFNKFDLKYFGRTDDGMWGKGIYFISDKRVAQSFGSDYLYTCRLKLNKPYIIDMSTVGNNEDSEDSSKYYSLTNRNNDVLKREGYDSIIVEDELWEGSFTTRANEYIVFDPSDIEIIDIKDLSLEESYNSGVNIDDIETPEQLMAWMDENITYELANDEYGAEDDPPTKTAEEVIETGKGHCAEQSYLEYKVLDELGYFPQLIFVKENNSEDDYGADGSAHMFVVYQDKDDKYTYFEHSQEHNRGIHKFDSMDELLDFVGKNWWRYDANSDILEVRYIDKPITGVDNWELAQECHKYPIDEVLDISNNVMEEDMISESLTEAKKRKKKKISQVNPGEAIFKSVKDMQKWVKKRQKGMGYFVHMDCGNMDYNNNMFNKMHGLGDTSSNSTTDGGTSDAAPSGGEASVGMGESLEINKDVVKLSPNLIQFMKDHKDLINEKDWDTLFLDYAEDELSEEDQSQLVHALISIGCDIEVIE